MNDQGIATRVPDEPIILHVEEQRSQQLRFQKAVGKHPKVIVAASVAEGLSTLSTRRVWTAIVLNTRFSDGTGWELLAKARKTHQGVPKAFYTDRLSPAAHERAYAERVVDLRTSFRAEVIRGFILEAQTKGQGMREELQALAHSAALRFALTTPQQLLIHSVLCGLPLGRYVDGRVVSRSSVKSLTSVILDQARKEGLDFKNVHRLCQYLIMQLLGFEADAISGVNIRVNRPPRER